MTRPVVPPQEVLDPGRLAATMTRAAKSGTWDGVRLTPYFDRCRWVFRPLGCKAIYTRDVGYHTSGWWKNPDYERCFHLSLSFVDPETGEPAPRDPVLTALFLEALFGPHRRWLWCEPPHTQRGKRLAVWHYRLFCDPAWEPIKPRGEVYSRELTEAGWRSFSDVQADLAAAARAAQEKR